MAEFKPYVPDEDTRPELTVFPLIMGTLLGLVFAGASLYLVLKVGLTTSASIPVAVLAATLFRAGGAFGLRRTNVLENNIIQTAGSAGESIAFGVGVTVPAFLLLGFDMDLVRVVVISVLGGLLGILAMIPLRRAFVVKMHGRPGEPNTLLYPEGTATAQVLISNERGGRSGLVVLAGLIVGGVFKLLVSGVGLLREVVAYPISYIHKKAVFSHELSPELTGVGYIIGLRTSSIMLAGGLLGSLVIVPLIAIFGDAWTVPLAPENEKTIKEMSDGNLRGTYLRFIGAGCVAAAGIISMFKTLPTLLGGMLSGLRTARGGGGETGPKRRTEDDLPPAFVFGGAAILLLALGVFLAADVGPVAGFAGAALVLVFGFLFVTVSARLTGEIGSSSNPISGMTVATLMLTCLIFAALGWTSSGDRVLALSIAAVVCIASSNGGTTAQALKSGFLVGGTPRKMQYAILVGSLVSALALGFMLYVLNRSATIYSAKPEYLPKITLTADEVARLPEGEYYEGKLYKAFDTRNDVLRQAKGGYTPRPEVEAVLADKATKQARFLVDPDTGKPAYMIDFRIMGQLTHQDDGTEVKRDFEAPKTQVMGLIINGVLGGKLDWSLILVGAMIAVVLELCKISSLAFAVGLYVPLSNSVPIFFGGVMRAVIDRRLNRQAAADVLRAGRDPEKLAEADVKAIQRSETNPGVLAAAGLIAGGSLVGLALAFTQFSETMPGDLAAYGHPTVTLAAPQSPEAAARDAAAKRYADLDAPDAKEFIGESIDLNDADLVSRYAVKAGTTLALPGGTSHTTEADTTLGAVARDKLGRDYLAKKLVQRNEGKFTPAKEFEAGYQFKLAKPQWPAWPAYGLVLALLLYFGFQRAEDD